jgi:hypothetical protein
LGKVRKVGKVRKLKKNLLSISLISSISLNKSAIPLKPDKAKVKDS